MRADLGRLEPGDEALAELQLLLARRRDLVADRTRAVTRLRETLLALFPALERAFNFNTRGPLELLARYQSAGAIRRAGRRRIAAYLKKRGVTKADALAEKAVAAAKTQSATLPAQDVAAKIVAELAEGVLVLKQRVDELDGDLGRRFFARPEAPILSSFPGMGPILGAEFLVAVGDASAFGSSDRLAAYAGLVPAAHDSGKRVGNHRKGRGGNRVLKRVFYQSAFSSIRSVPESRAFYDRKRSEGKRHTQAVIALARRRVNVLWAMLRDGTTFETRSTA
jgi:transposase